MNKKIEEIKQIRYLTRLSQRAFGKEFGVSGTYIGQIETGLEPSEKIYTQILNKYGSLLNDKKNSTPVSIDYYPEVFGSCGSGQFVLSEQKELIQVPKKLFSHFSPQKQYSIINAIGDSMLPYIHNKDKLIVEHWQGEQIKDNQVYVFCYKDEIFVKRLVKNIDEIIVKSDNPDPMYRPRYIGKEDMNNVLIVGEIVGLMRDMR